jgi:hypothetical protein
MEAFFVLGKIWYFKSNQWPAGCQVFADSAQFAEFISLCEIAKKNWGKKFSYTLINSYAWGNE